VRRPGLTARRDSRYARWRSVPLAAPRGPTSAAGRVRRPWSGRLEVPLAARRCTLGARPPPSASAADSRRHADPAGHQPHRGRGRRAQTVLQLTLAVTGIRRDGCCTTPSRPHPRGCLLGAGAPLLMLFLPFSLASARWPAPTACTRPGGSSSAPAPPSPPCGPLHPRREQDPAQIEVQAAAEALGDRPRCAVPATGRPRLPRPGPAGQRLPRRDLPPTGATSIDEHLRACDGCTTYLDQIHQTVALLEQSDTTGTHTHESLRPPPNNPTPTRVMTGTSGLPQARQQLPGCPYVMPAGRWRGVRRWPTGQRR